MTTTIEPFVRLESTMAPLPRAHVDTDQIIPASYLKVTDRSGLAEGLFSNWRFLDDGSPNPELMLNQPQHQDAKILLAGENFGCGSSREHAAWALVEHGFQAVLSSRFADIFQSNALKNRLLPVTLPETTIQELFVTVADDPAARVVINLEKQRARMPWGQAISIEVAPFARHCLLQGIDQLGYLLEQSSLIDAYETLRRVSIETRDQNATAVVQEV